MDFDTYIFDLDGTLLDTLDDLTASTNYALASQGMPLHTREEIRQFVGNGVRKLMERAVQGGDGNPAFEETYQTFRHHYMLHGTDHTRPYEGITDMLQTLSDRGKRLAVVSNKFDEATRSLCSHYFGTLIPVAVGQRDGIRKKPAPDTVDEALRLLHCTRQHAVYVGDSDVDIATAHNSGLACVSVLWGFRSREVLLAAGAKKLVGSPAELLCL